MAFLNKGLKIIFHDEKNGKETVYHFEGGIASYVEHLNKNKNVLFEKPVYIEKPMAVTYEECCRINRISAETGVPCFVAYYRRYLPYFQKVKQLVEDGVIGNIANIQIRFEVPPRDLDFSGTQPWRLQPDIAGGGYFYDLAPHQIDMIQYIFGVIIYFDIFFIFLHQFIIKFFSFCRY